MESLRGLDPWQHPATRDVQDVLNQELPPDGVARGIRRDMGRIPVLARVVWETDGEEWIEGVASRWVRPVVLVDVSDRRLQRPWVWLPAGDVRRR